MIAFTYLFLFRSISGLQNGLGYAKKEVLRAVVSGLMGLILLVSMYLVLRMEGSVLTALATIWIVVSLLGVLGVEDSFNNNYNLLGKDVHFWELWATSGVVFAWVAVGGNMIPIAASVYPGLIIHKGLINKGSGLNFFSEKTDDPTGKTFSIPLLGIKVPRMSTMFRISLAVLSVMAMIINSSLDWSFTIHDILSWF